MKKIGVIGSGQVGETLANGFLAHGYAVMRGSRDPKKLDQWLKKAREAGDAGEAGESGANASIGDFAEAAAFGEIVVLAVKGVGAEEAVRLCGSSSGLDGKIVLDTTNPIANVPPTEGVLSYFTSPNESLMERLQAQAPAARFVKAFSIVGAGLMVNPRLPSKPTMFICGNDASAKADAREILDQFGWETDDLGNAVAARAIEPLCILWCIPGFLRNDWLHAFKMLRP